MKQPSKHKKHNSFESFLYFFFGLLLLAVGVIMLVFDIQKVGQHYLTQQQSAVGGGFVIFVSIVIFIVAYYSLSPFSKIREFIEGNKSKKTKE